MNRDKFTRLNGWQWLGAWLIVIQAASLLYNATHDGMAFPIADDGLFMTVLLSVSYLLGTLIFAEIGLIAILYGSRVKARKAKQDAERNSSDT